MSVELSKMDALLLIWIVATAIWGVLREPERIRATTEKKQSNFKIAQCIAGATPIITFADGSVTYCLLNKPQPSGIDL